MLHSEDTRKEVEPFSSILKKLIVFMLNCCMILKATLILKISLKKFFSSRVKRAFVCFFFVLNITHDLGIILHTSYIPVSEIITL